MINISEEQNFRIAIIDSTTTIRILDILITQMILQYKKIMEISNDFKFLFHHSITNMNSHFAKSSCLSKNKIK